LEREVIRCKNTH